MRKSVILIFPLIVIFLLSGEILGEYLSYADWKSENLEVDLKDISEPIPSKKPLQTNPFEGANASYLFDNESKGPHGGLLVGDLENEFEVLIIPFEDLVTVYTLKANQPLPEYLQLNLFWDPRTGETVNLEAVNPNDALPRFEGQTITIADASFIGFQVSYGFKSKKIANLSQLEDQPQSSPSSPNG